MSPRTPDAPVAPCSADAINRDCFCIRPDLPRLHRAIGANGSPGEVHAGLFSSVPVFISADHAGRMRRVIAAVEEVAGNDGYRAEVLADAPREARLGAGVPGVLHGFDFHLTDAGPRLIEINSNAGGALLVTRMLDALQYDQDCGRLAEQPAAIEQALWHTFLDAWQTIRADARPARVAIIDESPRHQYLYPEFLLFQRLFEAHGVAARIADAGELTWDGRALRHQGDAIDLVYNRLTDFYLEGYPALRDAVAHGSVVLTPNPHDHALYANKRNLRLLTDTEQLRAWGVSAAAIDVLGEHVPATEVVVAARREELWQRRRSLFFKPARGYGGRGSYRGDKLTRSTFESLLAADYVAQSVVPPAGRGGDRDDPSSTLKFDVRSYAYRGRELLRAARLYRGQTTNFRTPGGGFAPVFELPAACP